MLGIWTAWTHGGNPKFSAATANPLTVTNDSTDDRGTWLAWWNGEIKGGDRFVVKGRWSANAQPLVVFDFGGGSYGTLPIPDDRVITLPNGVVRLRLDGRLWGQTGTAEFHDYSMEVYEQPPDPQPEEAAVHLAPIDNPDGSYAFDLAWTAENLPAGAYFLMQHRSAPDAWESFATVESSPFHVAIDRLGEQCFRVIAARFANEVESVIATSEPQCTAVSELPFPQPPANTEARGFSGKKWGNNIMIILPGDDINPDYEPYLEVYGYMIGSMGFFQVYNDEADIG